MRHLLLAVLVLAAACGETVETTDGEPDPGVNADVVDGKADIYGADSRSEPWASEAPLPGVRIADATAMVFSSFAIAELDDSSYTLSSQTMEQKWSRELGGPICEGERFADQPAPGFCSAFLIAPDLVATAGHCVNVSVGCEQMFFAFDYASNRDGGPAQRIPKDRVYRCETIVGHHWDRGEQTLAELASGELWSDWAVVKLDRPVTDREPVNVTAGAVSEGDRVVTVGHPSGLPMKITDGEVVDATKKLFFNTDLDIYRGNSGSIVVDNDSNAVGIVSRGTGGASFVPTDDGCFTSRVCEEVGDRGCTGNHVIRTEPVLPFSKQGLAIGSRSNIFFNGNVPDDQDLVAELSLPDAGAVSFVTLNLNGFHQQPADLVVTLEHGGRSHELLRNPKVWKAGSFRMSRTSHEFDGLDASGTWRLRVRDTRDATKKGRLDWWQVVVGTGSESQPRDPQPREPFVGAPCATDADCDFVAGQTPGFCHRFDVATQESGFCSVPCEGYCPDAQGWATTFCIGSGVDGMGLCAAKAEALNGSCSEIAGTEAQWRDRFIGTSSAPPDEAIVCAPAQ